MNDNIVIELDESGVLAVHADIEDAALVHRIAPGISMLNDFIQRSKAWAEPESEPAKSAATPQQ